jgi:hypothetical protein
MIYVKTKIFLSLEKVGHARLQIDNKSVNVLTICLSPPPPLLYVVASVEAQASEYQGMLPASVALLMDSVKTLFV